MRHAAVRVPATTANLGPGFDAFGLALTRFLRVRSLPRSSQTERVRAAGDGAGEIEDGDGNLIWRSVVAFCDHHGVPVPDVALRTSNQIPLERGLGSSSAATVAGLALARALTDVRVGDRDLVALAARIEGHPDNVAPALLGGLVACAPAEDGGWVVRRVNPHARLRPVAFVPATRQATHAARGVLPASLSRADAITQAARAGHVLGGLVGAWPVDSAAAVDLLHEPARMQVMGPTGEVLRELRKVGVHAWLSGAGPSIAALMDACDADLRGQAEAVATRQDFATWDLEVELSGAFVCLEGGCTIAGDVGANGATCVHCPREAV